MGVLQSILLTHPLIIKTNNGGYKPWINKLDTCTWTWTGNYHNQVIASGHKYGEMQFYHTGTFDHFFFITPEPTCYMKHPLPKFLFIGVQQKTRCEPAEQIMKRVCFLEIFAIFNFRSNLVEYQCINLTY